MLLFKKMAASDLLSHTAFLNHGSSRACATRGGGGGNQHSKPASPTATKMASAAAASNLLVGIDASSSSTPCSSSFDIGRYGSDDAFRCRVLGDRKVGGAGGAVDPESSSFSAPSGEVVLDRQAVTHAGGHNIRTLIDRNRGCDDGDGYPSIEGHDSRSKEGGDMILKIDLGFGVRGTSSSLI